MHLLHDVTRVALRAQNMVLCWYHVVVIVSILILISNSHTILSDFEYCNSMIVRNDILIFAFLSGVAITISHR